MQQVHFVENAATAAELLKPERIKILSQLARPRTCTEIARELGMTTQKVNYHMNLLKEAGLVELLEERRKRGTIEGVYRAAAKSFWFSPRLISGLGGKRSTSEQASLAYLLRLTEELQIDIGRLADDVERESVPTLAFDGEIELADASDRAAFYQELQESVKQLARKYGRRRDKKPDKPANFRFALVCYPGAIK